jgi:Protein of unknown function (DUF3108)
MTTTKLTTPNLPDLPGLLPATLPCARAARPAARRVRRPLALAGALAALLAAPWAGAQPAAGLQPFQASYLWYWHGARIALSRVTLARRQADTWVYSSSTSPRGLGHLYPMRPVLRSVMRVTPQGIEPLRFVATGSGRRHDADVTFDWDSGRATGIYEGVKVDMPIHPGVQDDLSVQIAMLSQLLQGHTPDSVMEINRNSVREYDYTRVGKATIDTALGRMETIVYASTHPGSPRTTRFWCAPLLGYIPVQVQQKRLNSVEWTMRIRSLHGRP